MATDYRHTLIIGLGLAAAAPWIIGATATSADKAGNNTIVSIVGTGASQQQAQLITISAGVESFGTDASDAMRQNSTAMASIRAELKRNGIDPKDIRTQGMHLSPGSRNENHEEIKGFSVTHNLSIVFRNIDKSGAVLDTLVKAGANQINGPSFSTDADEHISEIARTAAIRDANERAQYYARNLGLRVKRIVTMRDSQGYASSQPSAMASLGVAPDTGTRIAEGQDVVRVSVYADYELEK
ncbi:MAG: SIMPL domain-containing protein [Sphingomonas sp.]